MRLILFRHAPAEERDEQLWPDDLLRPLTARGIQRARRASRGILRLEGRLARILTSPARRALETANELSAVGGEDVRVEVMSSLAPGGSWRETLRALAREDQKGVVALVGHEPDLGKLAGVLLFGASAAVPLKKAGACAIDLESPAAGAGRLRWLLSPGALRALANKNRKRSRT